MNHGVNFRGFDPQTDWEWFYSRAGGALSTATRGITAVDNAGTILAVAIFDHWSGNSVFMSYAVDDRRAFRRGFLEECRNYIFDTCDMGVALAKIAASNVMAFKCCKHLGFSVIHTVKDGCARGDDLHILELKREDSASSFKELKGR